MLNAKSPALWISLAALTLLTRLPYFFVDVIDWDESTFILMGHALLNGFLPYEHIWDLKPPAIFFFFAGVIGLGDDVLMVRIAAMLLVLGTAAVVYGLARRLHSHQAGVSGALVYVLSMCATASGQALTSELIATLPVLTALWLLLTRRGLGWYLLIGALLSFATLVRLNLAFVVIAFAVLIPLHERAGGIDRCVQALVAYGVGGLVVLLAFIAPYALSGQFSLFWYSVFEAPFRYATEQSGPLENFLQHAFNAMGVRWGFDVPQFAVGVAAWLAGVGGILAAIKTAWAQKERERSLTLATAVVVMLATGLSIVFSGVAPMHYLIGLLPFMTVFAGVAYAWAAERGWALAGRALIAVCALAMLAPLTAEYRSSWQRLAGGGELMHGPSFGIAAYLREPCADGCSVYLLEDHLAYALLNVDPPRKIVTHPSNISKPSLLNADIGAESSPDGEMQALLATHPEFIVKRERVWYLLPSQEQMLEQTLQQHYRVVHEVDGRRIYQANAPAPVADGS